MGSKTERAERSRQSILLSDEQRFAKPLDSLGAREKALQSPAKPSGTGRERVVLAVGML